MGRKRILWIDYVKGLCMMTIILNHIPGLPVSARLTYPYELICFFFVGGYTLTLKGNFRSYLSSKIQRLLFPIIAFGLINLMFAFLYKNADPIERLKGIFLQLPGQYDEMWFVACLFIMEIIIYPLLVYIKSGWICMTIALSGVVLAIDYLVPARIIIPWHITNALLFLPVILCGYLARSRGWIEMYRDKIRTDRKLLLLPIAVYSASVLTLDNWPIDIHLLEYGNFPAFVLSSVAGLWMIVSISMKMEQFSSCRLADTVGFIGRNSLTYYGLQSKAISTMSIMLPYIGITGPQGLSKLTIWIASLTVLAGISYMVNHWLPFLTGNFADRKRT